jgi:hypothetical protein
MTRKPTGAVAVMGCRDRASEAGGSRKRTGPAFSRGDHFPGDRHDHEHGEGGEGEEPEKQVGRGRVSRRHAEVLFWKLVGPWPFIAFVSPSSLIDIDSQRLMPENR